ncbi:MAG: hypothetical protein KC550_01820, partial [Nanoarchaeota archaeon]|nr:hypothetical protein [Nanoarchaeota archaeon]
MKKEGVLIFIIVSFIMITSSYAPSISSCNNFTSSGIYTLSSDILNSSVEKCMNISSNNVVLDCQGYSIEGDGITKYGIYAKRGSSEDANITIQNCHLNNWNADTFKGVMNFEYTDKINIINSSSNNNAFLTSGLSFNFVEIVNINNFTGNNNYYGINLVSNANNVIINNSITNNNNIGVYVQISTNINLSNYISSNNTEGIKSNSGDFNINNFNISDNRNYGIHFYNPYTNTNNILNGIVSENGKFDIWLGTPFTGSDCDKIIISNVNSSENREIKLQASSGSLNNKEYGELIICDADGIIDLDNVTVNGSNSLKNNGIIFYNHNVAANSVWNNIKSEGNLYGVYTGSFAYLLEIKNSQFIDNEYGFYFENFGNLFYPNKVYNSTFNNTYNIYLNPGINDGNYWNNSIEGNYYFTPDGTGISDLCSDLNSNGICDYPYQHLFNNTDYLPKTKKLGNIYNFSISSCQKLFEVGNHTLANSILNSNKTKCMEIVSENISLDCQNYLIQGQDISNSIGIYSQVNNGIVKNCNILNWMSGVFFSNQNSNNISNSNIYDNTYGIYFNQANNN